MTHSFERIETQALLYRQTSQDREGKFKITKTCASDADRDVLLLDVTFTAPRGYALYVPFDPALKNSGYGDTGFTQDDALVAQKEDISAALVSTPGFTELINGFVGTSDGYSDLLRNHALTKKYAR
jgi:glucoamylase